MDLRKRRGRRLTARSTSAAPPVAKRASTSPVAGSRLSISPLPSTHSPPISRRCGWARKACVSGAMAWPSKGWCHTVHRPAVIIEQAERFLVLGRAQAEQVGILPLHPVGIGVRFRLDEAGALVPRRDIAPQSLGGSGRGGHGAGQHDRILQRAGRAMPEERRHRMGGIAQQGYLAIDHPVRPAARRALIAHLYIGWRQAASISSWASSHQPA